MAQGYDAKSRSNIAKIIKVEKDELDPLGVDELLLVKARLLEAGFSENDIPSKEDLHSFGHLDFRNLVFSKSLLMSHRLFPTFTVFKGSQFDGNVNFSNSTFESVHFDDATFKGHAYFRGAQIGTFGNTANACQFIGSTFAKHANFAGAGIVNGDFTKAEFNHSADFLEVIFHRGCPSFFESKLPENTLFTLRFDSWKLPFTSFARDGSLVDFSEADLHRQATKYSALRKRMEQIQRSSEAKFFMRKELSLKSELKGWDAFLILLYGWFSGYGGSIKKPLVALTGLIGAGAVFYAAYFDQTDGLGGGALSALVSGIGMSFTGTFSFLGLGRIFFGETLSNLPATLSFIYGLQTLLGFVLSFLLGMGVRDHLRLD